MAHRTENISDALILVEKVLSGAQIADDLIEYVALAFNGRSPGQALPAGGL